jgi:trimeric autotransporter adhesin
MPGEDSMAKTLFRAAVAAAIMPFSVLAMGEALAQTPRECPGGDAGSGDQDGTGNAACPSDASAYGQFNLASGQTSSAFGSLNTASAFDSSAFGFNNTASGGISSAFGANNTANGEFSSAFGTTNTASGGESSAFGLANVASGGSSSAFGTQNFAGGSRSSAFGYRSTAGEDADGALAVGGWYDRDGSGGIDPATEFTFALGRYSAAVGTGVRAEADRASAFGVGSVASGDRASAFGFENEASGSGSSAIGRENLASAPASVSFGAFNTADGENSTAFGFENVASEDSASAFGRGNTANGNGSMAFGLGNRTDGLATSASGRSNTAEGDFSSAFGYINAATGIRSSAIGHRNVAEGLRSSAFGHQSTTGEDADGALAVGGWYDRVGNGSVVSVTDLTFALGRFSVAVGTGVRAEEDFSSAFGVGAIASAEGATAIGFESVADRAYTVAIGSEGSERNLIHVADGTEDTDAVNLRQLNLAVAGAGGAGADLTPVAAALGAGAAWDAGTATFTAPSFTVAGVSFDNAGDAFGALDGELSDLGTRTTANADGLTVLTTNLFALDGRVTTAEDDILDLQGQISAGGSGLVLQSGADGTVTVAASTGGDAVALSGTDGARRLTGVADGDVSADSDEAVTGGQLFAASAAISANTAGLDQARTELAGSLGAGASYDAATGVFTAPSFTVMGSAYGDVGGTIGALNTQVGQNTTDIADLKALPPGGGGGSDPAQDARIAVLEAQLAALQSTLQTQNEALQMAMGELGELRDGNVTGGTTTDGSNLAVGEGSQATGFGDTAVGVGASATGDPSTAVGYQALASGQHSTAIGGNAEATGDLSAALGQGSVASGANSLALGQGAQATHANAIAIGQGVQTSRDDQVAIGSASSTYTLAGINSSASRAAQSGPVYAVTADGAGNLATMDMQPWFGRIEGLEESVRQTDDRFRTQADGIAVALALGGAQVIQPGQTFALSANMGHFDGANAAGFGAIGRLEENVFVNLGVGHGFRTGTVAGRAGVSWGW